LGKWAIVVGDVGDTSEMAEHSESFSQRVLAAFPVPYDETAEYSRFVNYFVLVSVVLTITFLYGLHLIPLSFWPFAASDLAETFRITRSRILFLDAHDKYFSHSYAVTLVGSICALPFVIGIHLTGYWKTVVKPGRCRPTAELALPALLYVFIFFSGCFLFIFFFAPWSFDVRYPGTTAALFWPIFPAVGGMVTVMFGGTLSVVAIGAWKILRSTGRRG
jgi:hypothetical protein